jgi:squalene cyclase
MTTLSLRTLVRNAAAVFSGCYGAVTRQAEQAGCSRQTVYDHARLIERRLQPAAPALPPAEVAIPVPTAVLDEPTRRRLAVTAFAMGISTRQIEDLLRVILPEDGPDHSTIGRWIADESKKAEPVLEALDAACIPRVQTLAVDEIFFGGDRPWSGSSRGA